MCGGYEDLRQDIPLVNRNKYKVFGYFIKKVTFPRVGAEGGINYATR